MNITASWLVQTWLSRNGPRSLAQRDLPVRSLTASLTDVISWKLMGKAIGYDRPGNDLTKTHQHSGTQTSNNLRTERTNDLTENLELTISMKQVSQCSSATCLPFTPPFPFLATIHYPIKSSHPGRGGRNARRSGRRWLRPFLKKHSPATPSS